MISLQIDMMVAQAARLLALDEPFVLHLSIQHEARDPLGKGTCDKARESTITPLGFPVVPEVKNVYTSVLPEPRSSKPLLLATFIEMSKTRVTSAWKEHEERSCYDCILLATMNAFIEICESFLWQSDEASTTSEQLLGLCATHPNETAFPPFSPQVALDPHWSRTSSSRSSGQCRSNGT